MTERTKVTLPAPIMRAIELVVADQESSPRDAFIAAALISLGHGFLEQQAEIDPTTIQIPDEQWLQISQWLVERKDLGSDIDRVNYGLSWMNQGPSAFTPAAQPQAGS